MNEISHIRNFAIVAHIDHGKSTLADRMIETCGGLNKREMKAQVLDSMDIERERGITIKAQTVRLSFQAKDGRDYILNLIDTPGHVDFSYEVSRSLAACEGSILLVDSSQGVEAQTLANVYQAIDANHDILIVLNKIDLPASEPEKVKQQIEDVIGIDASESVYISAKTGHGVKDVLEELVIKLSPPSMKSDDELEALLVDSWYDAYLGVVILVRVYNGRIEKGMKLRMMAAESDHIVEKVGVFDPKARDVDSLSAGEIGFVIAGIKQVADTSVGDTLTNSLSPISKPLSGFKPSIPVVFCGLFPIDSGDYIQLKDSLEKLKLNDSSFIFEKENSPALGFGFRCGFLGLLHLEIIQERLEREFKLNLITTAPSVIYKAHFIGGKIIELHNPADWPDPTQIDFVEEPWIKATIMVPDEYLGSVLKLCEDRRGSQEDLSYIGNRAVVVYKLPLNEVVFDFYDRLKSISKGYASFDYQLDNYEKGNLVKMQILVNNEGIDALSMIVNKLRAESRGRVICERLKDLIPRQLFKVPIQAAIGGKVIARETLSAMRKDVLAKCYGGDISRKRKLLEKQKKGKKRMRQFGKIEIPQDAFIAALKIGDD